MKVLKSLRRIDRSNVREKTVRGQYTAGFAQGKKVPGYLEEEGANKSSNTETFVAIRVDIDNWRWAEQWIPHATWYLYALCLKKR